jgi:hypothetical protein
MGGRNQWVQLGNRRGNTTSGAMNETEELVEEILEPSKPKTEIENLMVEQIDSPSKDC